MLNKLKITSKIQAIENLYNQKARPILVLLLNIVIKYLGNDILISGRL